MAGVKIKLNVPGFYALRSDPGVVEDLEARASALAAACGEGYETGSQQGAKRPQGRWRTSVVTTTYDAIRDNAKHNTLINNLGAAG